MHGRERREDRGERLGWHARELAAQRDANATDCAGLASHDGQPVDLNDSTRLGGGEVVLAVETDVLRLGEICEQ